MLTLTTANNHTKSVINIFGYIGDDSFPDAEFWGITGPQQIVDEIQEAKRIGSTEIEVNLINTPGGEVDAGLAIFDLLNTLKLDGIEVNTIATGMVASISSIIFLSGTNRRMNENSKLLIHNVSGGIFGDIEDIESYLEQVKQDNEQLIGLYVNATGLEESIIAEMMSKETVIMAEDAVTMGFATEVINVEEKTIAFFKHKFSKQMSDKPLSIKDRLKNIAKGVTDAINGPKNLEIALTNGQTAFVDTAESTPESGNLIKIDGQPLETGEYVMQSTNQMLTVENGEIKEVKEASTEDAEGMEAVVASIEILSKTMATFISEQKGINAAATDGIEAIGKLVSSNFKAPKKDNRIDTDNEGKSDPMADAIEAKNKKRQEKSK